MSDDMRKEFEAWFLREIGLSDMSFHDGIYTNRYIGHSWIGYQAGRASVPSGWKLVPVEPTEAMMEVYKTAFSSSKRFDGAEVYKAMISAAPDQEGK